MTSPSGKIKKKKSDREKLIIAQNYGIFCQFRSKLAISHTIAIKWKEKNDAVVVDAHAAQSVTCLVTDACLTAYPCVTSLIPARSHTFIEIDHEIL